MKYDKFFIAFAFCVGMQATIGFCGTLPTYDPNELNKQLHNPELYLLFRKAGPIEKNKILNFFGPNDVEPLRDYYGKLGQELKKSSVWEKEWLNEFQRLRTTPTLVGSEDEQMTQRQLEPYKKEVERANDLIFTRDIIEAVTLLIEQAVQ